MAAFTEIWSWFASKYSLIYSANRAAHKLSNFFFMSLGIVYFFIIFVRCQWQVVKPLRLFLFKGGVFHLINPTHLFNFTWIFFVSFNIFGLQQYILERRATKSILTKNQFKMSVNSRTKNLTIPRQCVLHADIQLKRFVLIDCITTWSCTFTQSMTLQSHGGQSESNPPSTCAVRLHNLHCSETHIQEYVSDWREKKEKNVPMHQNVRCDAILITWIWKCHIVVQFLAAHIRR